MTIEVKITANNADEVQSQLEDLLSLLTGPSGEAEKPKAKRRTKAEIAADKEVEAEAAKEAEAPVEEPVEVVEAVETPVAPKKDPATKKDVEEAIHALFQVGAEGTERTLHLLTTLEAVNADGDARLSALDPSRYDEAAEMAAEMLAKIKDAS